MVMKMKTRQLTCIVCPRGCALVAELSDSGEVVSVSGNLCPRGKTYAVDECTNPMRTVTSTVRCKNGAVVAVKTAANVPKSRVFDVMDAINATVAPDAVRIGDVIVANVCDLGVDVVATANS